MSTDLPQDQIALYTVGHGARSLAEFAAALESVGLSKLVDVRRYPFSKRHPHFAKEALAKSLAERGIAYEWWGDELGGRRDPVTGPSRHQGWRNDSFQAYADYMDTSDFREALNRLLDLVRKERVAVMCAETLWWRCHRRLIADAAALAGTEVLHIFDERTIKEHPLHPSLRKDDEGYPVYDVNVDRELL
ncbi:MAG: DUF488 domain-containing protein [Actinomycetota bacterium]|nr:DUF488 domain-containing protein [Actinomycetota bacterium]